MATLVAIAYPEQHRAQEARGLLMNLQKQYLIDLAETVVVTRDANGKIHLDQGSAATAAGAMHGALWGMLIGLLFFVPLLGAAVGAASGAIAGRFADYGIDHNFMRSLADKLAPGTSALFVLMRGATNDRVVTEMSKLGGTVLQTSLPTEAEERLQSALTEGVA
jgi:uncharacterized membrane protein